MATVNIRSPIRRFRMIDTILRLEDDIIEGMADFVRAPAFAGLEAMAQLAALHVRWRVDFSRHAFLLSVVRCHGLPDRELDGTLQLQGRVTAHSMHAIRYRVTAATGAGKRLTAELFIGLRDYDTRFRSQRLQDHYREMVARLQAAPQRTGPVDRRPQDPGGEEEKRCL